MKISYQLSQTLIFVILSSLPLLSLSFKCNSNDKKVLLQIKNALNNPNRLASWHPETDCCSWDCLWCDPTSGRVRDLTIFQASISSQIPPQVGDLPYLTTLTFHHITNLTGQIPSSVTKLTRLEYLEFSYTNLSGSIPSFLGQMNSLIGISLSFNEFSGEIPSSLGNLTNLYALLLDRNKLTGKIPDSFGEFTGRVPHLYLSHNQLSGSVPKSLGNLNFSILDFSRNNLEGDISFLFGRNKEIQSADFSRNMFEFNLSNVEFPKGYLDLNHNKIYGNLPESTVNLYFLNVSYNRLCGKIPTGGSLQTFESTAYFHNRCLCGAPLPALSAVLIAVRRS